VNSLSCIRCNICNKSYASRSSLCNHNRKFHSNNVKDVKDCVKDCVKDVKDIKDINEKKVKTYNCDLCNKLFSSRQSLYEHKIKVCRIKQNNIWYIMHDNEKMIISKKDNYDEIFYNNSNSYSNYNFDNNYQNDNSDGNNDDDDDNNDKKCTLINFL
jgi:hypothetical protein